MSDLISREEAQDAVRIAYDMCGADIGTFYKTAIGAIKTMPSAEQWIPCSERLPSENGNYLVTAIWNGKLEVDMDYFQFLCQWDDYKDTVIAWMPLPKPWKGEQND